MQLDRRLHLAVCPAGVGSHEAPHVFYASRPSRCHHLAVDDWVGGRCAIVADALVDNCCDLSHVSNPVPFSCRLVAFFGGAFTNDISVSLMYGERLSYEQVETTPPRYKVS